MDRVSLFQEYRLVERSESEINGVWKGAHLLLFFMAFVFGSFCTFCFHMLMYLFDEKCVLFPKLQSLKSLRHNVIYEFIPVEKEAADMLPVDFLSSQWVEKSTCYLPTYVPLLSGIFGLVWTTMFLMCSTGSRTLTGLQRPWRVLPPVFIFSLAMGGLCIYSSTVTHNGLQELCLKLGEISGTSSCSYTVNVATLIYERRIRGVYQAIRLTIISAWLHTICWLLSAALATARVLLAVDFQLVCVNVDLIGNIEKMLEQNETQIRTVSPDIWFNEHGSTASLDLSTPHSPSKVHFTDAYTLTTYAGDTDPEERSRMLYMSQTFEEKSNEALVPSETYKLARLAAFGKFPKKYHFIIRMLYNLIQNADLTDFPSGTSVSAQNSQVLPITRQLGKDNIKSSISRKLDGPEDDDEILQDSIDNSTVQGMMKYIYDDILRSVNKYIKASEEDAEPSTSKPPLTDLDPDRLELSDNVDTRKRIMKSNLKHASMQTEKRPKKNTPKVHITEPEDVESAETDTMPLQVEKETQTSKKKEKQD